jgi:hypothetical protein
MIISRAEAHAANPVFSYGEPWSDGQKEAVRDLALQGLSRSEIGLRIGRTRDSVSKVGTELGVRFARDSYGGTRGPDRAYSEDRKELEERSKRLVRAVAGAIYRGEHLPGAVL